MFLLNLTQIFCETTNTFLFTKVKRAEAKKQLDEMSDNVIYMKELLSEQNIVYSLLFDTNKNDSWCLKYMFGDNSQIFLTDAELYQHNVNVIVENIETNKVFREYLPDPKTMLSEHVKELNELVDNNLLNINDEILTQPNVLKVLFNQVGKKLIVEEVTYYYLLTVHYKYKYIMYYHMIDYISKIGKNKESFMKQPFVKKLLKTINDHVVKLTEKELELSVKYVKDLKTFHPIFVFCFSPSFLVSSLC